MGKGVKGRKLMFCEGSILVGFWNVGLMVVVFGGLMGTGNDCMREMVGEKENLL